MVPRPRVVLSNPSVKHTGEVVLRVGDASGFAVRLPANFPDAGMRDRRPGGRVHEKKGCSLNKWAEYMIGVNPRRP